MTTSNNSRSYVELVSFNTYEERLAYLRLYGSVGLDTFGFDRYLNQRFYRSPEWKQLRKRIFLRDNGCDLGVKGYDIVDPRSIIIHHINPLSIDDIYSNSELLLDPNNLITVSRWTHNIIHFGDETPIPVALERSPNDTCPWKNTR